MHLKLLQKICLDQKKKKFKWQKKLIDYKRFERYFDLKKAATARN